MARFKKYKNTTSKKSLLFFGLLLLCLVGFLLVANIRQSQKRNGLIAKINYLQNEIQELEQKKQQLQAEISQNKDDGYLEKIARENLNLKKEGEMVVGFLVEGPKGADEEATTGKQPQTFWQKLLDKFKLKRD